MGGKSDAASSNSTERTWLGNSGTSTGTASKCDSWKLWCDTSSRGHTYSEAALVDCLSNIENCNRTRVDWHYISTHWDGHGWFRGGHGTSRSRDFRRMNSRVEVGHSSWCDNRSDTTDARNVGCSQGRWRWSWSCSNRAVRSGADNWDRRTSTSTAGCRGR